MRALVVNPDGHCPAGLVGDRLAHHGIELDELVVVAAAAHPVSDVEFPDPRDYDLIVPTGSPWSVYDTATIGSWIGRELDLLRTAVKADVAVLGICFGGQALAAALGGTVERSPQAEFGWYEIDSSVAAIASGPWFQWHFDRFSVPEGSTVLAHSDVGVQAFRFGRSLGVQFHPELTTSILEGWLADADEAELRHLDGTPEGLLAETAERQEQARPHTEALVDHFLTDIARLT
jgi:GMP synthase-like glutamine amidotransferase